MFWVGQRVFHRQHASPAVAEQVKIGRVHAQCLPDFVDFLNPPRDVPQILFRLVAVETAELVVHVHFRRPASKAGMARELVGDVEHVLVGACRAAVEHQDFGVLAGAELLGEHLVPVTELNHGHAVFGVFGGAQREVLLREGHGAIAGDVVIVRGF